MNLRADITHNLHLALPIAGLALFIVTSADARAAATLAQNPHGETELTLTATTANVESPNQTVTIDIIRWSTDEERNQLVTAVKTPIAPPATATSSATPPRGAAPAAPGAAGNATPAARGATPAAAAGAAANAAPPARGATSAALVDPVTKAIQAAPTIGFMWTSQVAGFSIKYAYRTLLPDGSQRIILATDRRIGVANPTRWHAKNASPASPETDYKYTLVELRIDPKGVGEGKVSLNTKVTVDEAAKTIALDKYTETAALLKDVKRTSEAKR